MFDLCSHSYQTFHRVHLTATGAQLPTWVQLPVMRAAGQHVVGCHDDIHRPVIVTHGHCLHHLCPVRQCNCNNTHITLSSMACSQEPCSRSGQPMTQDTVFQAGQTQSAKTSVHNLQWQPVVDELVMMELTRESKQFRMTCAATVKKLSAHKTLLRLKAMHCLPSRGGRQPSCCARCWHRAKNLS